MMSIDQKSIVLVKLTIKFRDKGSATPRNREF